MCLLHHRGEEAVGDLVLEEPVAIAREGAVVEALVIDGEIEEELEEEVIAEPLAELALAPDRVQGHQHCCLEQLLRGHALPTRGGVHGVEPRPKFLEDRLHHRLDPPNWVVQRDQAIGGQGGQHRCLPGGGTAHAGSPQADCLLKTRTPESAYVGVPRPKINTLLTASSSKGA